MQKPEERLLIKLPIEFRKSYSRSSHKGNLENISMTGAFLVHNNPGLCPKDKVNIQFQVSGRKRDLQATVIWMNKNGCGLSFKPESNRDVQIVDDLIYFIDNRKTQKKKVLEQIFAKTSYSPQEKSK